MEKTITISADNRAEFHNNAAFCIGTGRMGLALQQEYAEELAFVQSKAHFAHIRGHGLFADDMAIYRPYTDQDGVTHDAYNFTYLDRVMDMYKKNGLRPFLELGFMPDKMASGKQTVFYWHGNVTPPADESKWVNMVKATLAHLVQRYGAGEVSTWPCEVWNEPNLNVFWENRDKEKYLRLYEITSKAVKEVLPDMKVGGPAICGGSDSQDWVRDFLTFCRDKRLPLDMVTRHAYMGQTPERHGKYTYHEMCDVDFTVNEMRETREIIDSFPEYRGMEMHITEFNTSYNPLCPIHDTNLNAAYIAGLLAKLGDVAASYSYWTFGDVFEESDVPSTPFHGGFGLVAGGSIPKPTLWTFAFFNALQGEAVLRDENAVLVKNGEGFRGVLWNLCRSGREELKLKFTCPKGQKYTLLTKTVDEEHVNPLKCWHEMGEPASLDAEQKEFLFASAQPICETKIVQDTFELTLGANAVAEIKLIPYVPNSEYGYEYDWYLEHA